MQSHSHQSVRSWLLETQKTVLSGGKRNYQHFDKKPHIAWEPENGRKDVRGTLWVGEREKKMDSQDGRAISLDDFFCDFFQAAKVAERQFWPMIKRELKTKKFIRENGHLERVEDKKRPIHYASHFDSFILSYYAYLLGKEYDDLLKREKLDDAVIAYRHIERTNVLGAGKSNIDFADEVFEHIKKRGECVAIACDIDGFFDSVNHQKLEAELLSIIGTTVLPSDWKNILRFLTQFPCVDSDVLSKFREKGQKKCICSPKHFRKIRKENPGIIQHGQEKGIPQGTPISGLLANIYMLPFDKKMAALASQYDALYRRYSDDILFVCSQNDFDEIEKELKVLLDERSLQESEKKRSVCDFQLHDKKLVCRERQKGGKQKDKRAFQYLGFEFTGQHSYLRNTTLARYYQKANRAARGILRQHGSALTNAAHKELLGKLSSSAKQRTFAGYVRQAYQRCSLSKARQQFAKHQKNLTTIIVKKMLKEEESQFEYDQVQKSSKEKITKYKSLLINRSLANFLDFAKGVAVYDAAIRFHANKMHLKDLDIESYEDYIRYDPYADFKKEKADSVMSETDKLNTNLLSKGSTKMYQRIRQLNLKPAEPLPVKSSPENTENDTSAHEDFEKNFLPKFFVLREECARKELAKTGITESQITTAQQLLFEEVVAQSNDTSTTTTSAEDKKHLIQYLESCIVRHCPIALIDLGKNPTHTLVSLRRSIKKGLHNTMCDACNKPLHKKNGLHYCSRSENHTCYEARLEENQKRKRRLLDKPKADIK